MTAEGLDFTNPGSPSPAPPSPQKVAEAHTEASAGGPQLAKTGFYVAMARHATGGKVPPRNGERHVVLVVEDDAALARLVSEVLGKAGFGTRVARNKGELNVEFNKPPLPDIMLLDVSLPDADGFNILERIRANPRVARLPVILVTGKSEVTDVARGLAVGADGYVTKPFKLSGLVAAVNTVLGLD